jgi:pyrroline-5-carboxylate reductase
MKNLQIAFIGAGNMACSIIGGLIEGGLAAGNITACARTEESLQKTAQKFQVNTELDPLKAVEDADVVVLAVKPQILKEVALAIAPALTQQTLILSVAAGITTDSMAKWLGQELAIVRSMPNTPSLLQLGASGAFANANCSVEQRQIGNDILAAVGIVEWVDSEALLNPVTAVSGSGPAYYFLMMEAMIDAGVAMGLDRDSASKLTIQTALGAARLAQTADVDVAELRRRVTSPGGTTEQAINSFEQNQIRATFTCAMKAASDRGAELAEILAK